MAFADWTHNNQADSGAVHSQVHDLGSTIVGAGSLGVNMNSAFIRGGANSYLDGTHAQGYTSGRIRTLFEVGPYVVAGGNIGSIGGGIYYMASNQDISNITSAFYGVGLVRVRTGTGSMTPTIIKANAETLRTLFWHTQNPIDTIRQGADITGVTTGDVFALEIEWELDLVNLGGMRHRFSLGAKNDLNYNSLVEQWHFVEVNPFMVTTGEGVFYNKSDTAG